MNNDIRISTSFRNHRKRKKLAATIGEGATGYLLDLWIGVAMSRPNGILTGWDAMDVALEANYPGDPATFVQALCDVGFLDCSGDVYAVHDWQEHNPYASSADERSDKARLSKLKQAYPELHEKLVDGGVKSISASEYKRVVSEWLANGQRNASKSPAPSPSPSPSPKDKDYVEEESRPRIPYSEIVSYLNEKVGSNFRATTGKTKNCIKARWNEGFRVDDFKTVIDAKSDEWLVDENMVKYLRPETLFGNKFEGYLQAASSMANRTTRGKSEWI